MSIKEKYYIKKIFPEDTYGKPKNGTTEYYIYKGMD